MSNMEDGMDEDVAKEKGEVLGGKYSSNATVLLSGVAKSFVQKGTLSHSVIHSVYYLVSVSSEFVA